MRSVHVDRGGARPIGLPPDPKFCDEYHAADPDFWKRVYYWNTPVADCGDDRGDVCKDYNDWVRRLDRDQGVMRGRDQLVIEVPWKRPA